MRDGSKKCKRQVAQRICNSPRVRGKKRSSCGQRHTQKIYQK
nr:MAG TPA: hypothetical protein [Caudoviricetes sp.]